MPEKMQQVLVIDDSRTIHLLLDIGLRAEGIVLHHALDAVTGLQKARRIEPDLILLDMEMPGANGLDVCRELKADPVLGHIPVIFLTGSSDVAKKVHGFALGAVDYVTKPFEPAELRARVSSALRTKWLIDLLATRAQIDGLTGLYNRAYFDQRLADEMGAARRTRRAVSLIVVDIDHFKHINDTHGHPFGDRVIQAVARALQARRSTDAACRYGGEEFALILGETPLEGALHLATMLRERVAGLGLAHEGRPVAVKASFGVACSEELGEVAALTPARLVSAADGALYAAKRGGRDCVRAASRVTMAIAPPPAPERDERGAA